MSKPKEGDAGKTALQMTQIFGDKPTMESCSEEDIISAIQFDRTGRFLSLGDRAGRLIIFSTGEASKTKSKSFVEYQYLTELQSHTREFDYLKSCDIEEKINQMQWLRQQGKTLQVLTTNDKTIKLWKISEKNIKKIQKAASGNGKDLVFPKLQTIETGYFPTLRNVYANLHNYHINALSLASNDEVMISSDDLRVYLWNLEETKKAFNVVDLKPDNLDELSEVITSCQYHPVVDNMFLYSTSKGVIKVADLRKAGICDNTAIHLEEKEDPSKKNFFTEIVSSISDAIFSKNGKYVFSRDFLNVKVWDLAMTNKPVCSVPVFEPLKAKLCELYENECIFDKFNISSSSCSNYCITGNFNSTYHQISANGDNNVQYELNFGKKTIMKNIKPRHSENLGPNYDYTRKVLKSVVHPDTNCIALACLNCLYFYSGN